MGIRSCASVPAQPNRGRADLRRPNGQCVAGMENSSKDDSRGGDPPGMGSANHRSYFFGVGFFFSFASFNFPSAAFAIGPFGAADKYAVYAAAASGNFPSS